MVKYLGYKKVCLTLQYQNETQNTEIGQVLNEIFLILNWKKKNQHYFWKCSGSNKCFCSPNETQLVRKQGSPAPNNGSSMKKYLPLGKDFFIHIHTFADSIPVSLFWVSWSFKIIMGFPYSSHTSCAVWAMLEII